jgi:hypothetical protein
VHDANNFGVWKPLGGTDSISFYTHAPGNHLWLVGNGCSVLLRDSIPVIDTYNEIFTYAQAIADGTWPADRFYCGNIMMNTRDMGPVITAKLDSLLGMLDPLAANGMIVWETISGKLDAFNAWSAATGVASCQWSCEQASTAAVPAIEWPLMELSLSDGMLLVHGPWGPMVMRVMDPLGRSLWQGQVHDGQRISTAPWTGVVIAELRQGLHVKRMRMMVP